MIFQAFFFWLLVDLGDDDSKDVMIWKRNPLKIITPAENLAARSCLRRTG